MSDLARRRRQPTGLTPTPFASGSNGRADPTTHPSLLGHWIARFSARLHDQALVVVEIHVPSVDLDCAACHQPWPCHPYSAALTAITST